MPYTTNLYVRTNYQRTGKHFDYDTVEAVLPQKQLTLSIAGSTAYMTQAANVWSNELGPTQLGVVVSAMLWGRLLYGTLATSMWGSAQVDQSAVAFVDVFLSYSTSAPSLYLAVECLEASVTTSHMMEAGSYNACLEVWGFVVSR